MNFLKPLSWLSAILLIFSPLPASTQTGQPADRTGTSLNFEHVWIAEAPPVSRVLAAYLTIHNTGERAVTITGVRADGFHDAAMHRTRYENGLAKMSPAPTIELGAGKTVHFEPGGYHIMLFRPQRPLKAGDHTTLHFSLSNGQTASVTATVKKAGDQPVHHHHDHH